MSGASNSLICIDNALSQQGLLLAWADVRLAWSRGKSRNFRSEVYNFYRSCPTCPPTFTQPQGSCQLPRAFQLHQHPSLLVLAVLETQVACMPTELDVLNAQLNTREYIYQ